jgi:DNA-binding transcriptional LysR family regulator
VTGSVDDLQFFAVVAAAETLTAASRELGSSLPVVSKRLAALERRLGVQLVHRGTRKLELSPEGALYARRIDAVLDEIRSLEDDVAGGTGELRGSLVVESTLGLGRAHIGPLLGQFGSLHPGLDVQLQTSALPPSPHRRGFDVAVHVGAPQDSTLRIRKLADNRRVVCASPDYVERHGAPASLDELAEHNCIVLRENSSDFALWRFGDDGDDHRVRVNGTLSSNDGDVVTRWALEGRGLIMRSLWQVGPLLTDGQLTRVLPHLPTPSAHIYALHQDSRHVPPRVSQVIDHLAAGLAERLV